MPNIGPMELIIVLIIALLILGPKRLPAAGRSLGHGIREFKDGISGRDAAPVEVVAAPQPAPLAAVTETSTARQPAAVDETAGDRSVASA